MRNRMGSSLNLDTTVVGLQGFPISPTGPTSGQALVFDGTSWVPSDVAAGGHFVPQLDPTNDVSVSTLGGTGSGGPPLISAFETPTGPDGDSLAIRLQRDVDGTAIFLRGPTFPDPSAANGLQMWLGDGGNLLFNFTNTGQLNLPAMPVNPMDAIPKQYFDDALASLPPPAAVGSTPPSNPTNGQLWWDTVSGQLFIWYVDANSSQWVVANVSVGVPGPPGPAGPNVMPPGVTDGSNAAVGQVGEIITYNWTGSVNAIPNGSATGANAFSMAQFMGGGSGLPIPPGVWQVQIDVSFTASVSLAAWTQCFAVAQMQGYGGVFRYIPGTVTNGLSTTFGGFGITGSILAPIINTATAIASAWSQFNVYVGGAYSGAINGTITYTGRRIR